MLEGKVALVTAAASGIGRASAIAMAREGAKVVLGDINVEGAQAVADEIRAAGGHALATRFDATSKADNEEIVDLARKRFGFLHIAHLNAGGGADTSILKADYDRFDESIALNIKGCFTGLAAVSPAIIASGGGAIVVTSSQLGLLGQRHVTAYTTAKHALLGLVKCAAAELAEHNVRVNAVCPAAVYTGIFTKAFPTIEEADAALGRHNVLGRVGRAEEVAELVAFLASDRASFITATAVPIDGGDTALQSPVFMNGVESLGAKMRAFAN